MQVKAESRDNRTCPKSCHSQPCGRRPRCGSQPLIALARAAARIPGIEVIKAARVPGAGAAAAGSSHVWPVCGAQAVALVKGCQHVVAGAAGALPRAGGKA